MPLSAMLMQLGTKVLNCGVECVVSDWSHSLRLDQISDSCGSVSLVLMDEALTIHLMVMYAASSNVKSFMIWPDSLSLVKMLREETHL